MTRNQTPSRVIFESLDMSQVGVRDNCTERPIVKNLAEGPSFSENESHPEQNEDVDNFGYEADAMMGTSEFFQPQKEAVSKQSLFFSNELEGEKYCHAATERNTKASTPCYSITDQESADTIRKHAKRTSDLGTMPINYAEFLKKSDRSRQRKEDARAAISDTPLTSERCYLQESENYVGSDRFQRADNDEVRYHLTTMGDTEEACKLETKNFDNPLTKAPESYDRTHTRSSSVQLRRPRHLEDSSSKKNSREGIAYLERNSQSTLPTRKNSQSSSIHSSQQICTYPEETNYHLPVSALPQQQRSSRNESQTNLEDRLKGLEKRLSEMEDKNQGLKIEKDSAQLEFNDLLCELKQAKLATNSNSDIKGPKEAALKNEIKFLISKLLKVKGNLEKQSDELQSKRHPSISKPQRRSSVDHQGLHLDLSKVNSSQEQRKLIGTKPDLHRSSKVSAHSTSRDERVSTSNVNTGDNYQRQLKIKEGLLARVKSNKNSLNEAIQNFSKNVRSHSNLKDAYERRHSISVSTVATGQSKTYRAKTPILARP